MQKKRKSEVVEEIACKKQKMILSNKQLNALHKLKHWQNKNEFTGIVDPKSDVEELEELCKDANIEYTIYNNICNDGEEKWIQYDKKCETIQTFMRMECKQKEQTWMWLFEIFEEYDGRGAEGECASIDVQIKDKKKVKKAEEYGWIDIKEDEYHEVESMEMQVLTEDFYLDLGCVTDEEFLKKWKDELKELREIFEGSDSEEETSEEDE
tara:strand:+ start:230 stop:859 length:630 start_codon:yes stop_codon:yes gene_type:complete